MDKLQNFRNRIDKIDAKLITLIRKREKIIRKVGLFKAKTKKPIQNKKREENILSKLDTEMEKEVFKVIIRQSKKIQREV
jgi:chorismate mutase